MKKHHFLIVFALLLPLFSACTGQHAPSGGGQGEVTPTTTDIAVEREFTQINNLSNLDIYWREGTYSVRFEGNKMLLNDYDICIDDAGLTINELHEIAPELKARLYVSTPTLTIVSNYNSGTIYLTGTLHSDDLVIGNMVNGSIETDTLVCKKLKYTASDVAKARFGLIRGDEAALIADGSGTTDATLDVHHLILTAWGTQTVTLNGHADTKDIQCSRTNMVNDLMK